MITFSEGLKYPWGAPQRLWNILWIFVPIVGFFVIVGYLKKITNSIVRGNVTELPEFGKFGENLKRGFLVFVKLLPIYIALMIVSFIPYIGIIVYWLFSILFIPWLVINLMVKNTVESSFDFKKAWNVIFSNFGDYVLVFFKTIGFAFIYILASIILVGIPCYTFGSYIFLTDFYRRTDKKSK
jgi:hypothetical protein